MKKFLTICFLAFPIAFGFAQKKDVLLHIDKQPIYADEFVRVYKKNLDLVQDDAQKDVDGYLDLFIDYKLKIAEAKAQGLDKNETYQKEFAQYRDQLSRTYLFEEKILGELAKEAFERGKEEIDASHILIQVGPDAPARDTLAAYNKIQKLRQRALNGEDFSELARNNSEEPNARATEGRLGYFTAFSMVYPFETAAYNTKKGGVSEIVRSRFGYHIIKVHDRRPRMPRIQVSHIMVSENKGDQKYNPEQRINEIAAMLKQGKKFEDLASEFSDDLGSAVQGGKLNPFTKGELRAPEFEEAAYSLKNKGDVSEPVKTEFGWHIIRLDEKLAEETFEGQKAMLEKRVSQGDRSKVVTYTVNNKIKEKYGYKEGNDFLPFFMNYVSDTILQRKWNRKPIPSSQDKMLFTIGKKKVAYSDFAKYLEERQNKMKPYQTKEALLQSSYEEFETEILKNYFKEELEKENPEYAAVLNEYRDGLLIFDVMEKNIWDKAKSDSLGIQKYFANHRTDYRWKQRVEANIFAATSQANAQRVQKMLQEGNASDEIRMAMNQGETVNVLLSQGIFEEGHPALPANFELKNGISKIYHSNDSYTVVQVKEILPEGLKELEDVRGVVVSNYQNQLEQDWMKYLHNKYKVKVNQKTLKKLKKEL
ncbi:MAG TPA: peptidylprolyl isomerase [Flavobacteriaceae bacterium]|nr:peptidylprolyl isomerase [Flavobacteriaceae bacterium]